MSETYQNDSALDRDIEDLLQALYVRYGYDFREYAKASQKRRILQFVNRKCEQSVCNVKEKAISDKGYLIDLLSGLTIRVTSLFRDPLFFRSFAQNVTPYLKTYATFKIWHAGCSTGEEIFSLGILLQEENLLERAILYGTDINIQALNTAKKGIVPASIIKRDTKNYYMAGGKNTLYEYWKVSHGFGLLQQNILQQMVFSDHNLVTDHSFSEVQVIVCRNVLIYFNRNLQNRVLTLFKDSLSRGGYLCLGAKENLLLSEVANDFEEVDREQKIYRKKLKAKC